MTITLYTNKSDKNVMDKSITKIKDRTGTLRNDCSVIDPVIALEDIGSDITAVNYAYIAEFGRYYFINNIICKGNLFELEMHVDVLMTYKEGIRSNYGVIARNEKTYNLYLQDGVMKTYANPHIQIKQFPDGFSSYNFIFCVAG